MTISTSGFAPWSSSGEMFNLKSYCDLILCNAHKVTTVIKNTDTCDNICWQQINIYTLYIYDTK